MKQITITSVLTELSWDELSDDAKKTLEAAKEASYRAYAPYSDFLVGAAVLLEDGTIITGNNQENAAFPSGLCAERTAVFYANSRYPQLPVKILAVAAQTRNTFLREPVTPCGACRQVLLECEKRFKNKIEIYLYGTEKIYCLKGMETLLPLTFCSKNLSSL